MAYFPTSEQVAVAWLKTIDGVPVNGVATTLPGDNSTWAASGFVTVTTVGGSPGVDTPLSHPVVQVDCWACNVNSQKPPWGKAGSLASLIKHACYRDPFPQVVLDLGAQFHQAMVQAVYAVTEPRRLTDDPADFARVSMDLLVHWVIKERS